MYSKELLKGTLKPIILQLLAEHKEMYGYQIAKSVKERSQEKILIKEGSLYPILHSLTADGLLKTRTEHIGKRVRKYYSLTELGEIKVKALVAELKDFLKTVDLLIST